MYTVFVYIKTAKIICSIYFILFSILIIYSIITNQNDEINVFLNREHIEIFFEVLHKQMLIIGGLKLGLCTLHRINLPGITIMENKVSCVYIHIYLFLSLHIAIILFSWNIFTILDNYIVCNISFLFLFLDEDSESRNYE